MAPAELRDTVNETIAVLRLSKGDTRKYHAKFIKEMMRAYPWLADQVPYDIQSEIFGLNL